MVDRHGGDSMSDSADRSRPWRIDLPLPRWDRYLAIAVVLAVLHATSWFGDTPPIVLSVVTPILALGAVRAHRPTPSGPWNIMILAGMVWSAAAATRAAVGSTGDLSADRNLVPDVLAIAGYALFAIALIRMLKAQGHASRSRSLLLDGGWTAG